MKSAKRLLVFVALVAFIINTHAQAPTSVKEMVDSKRFVFEAQSVSPQKGGMRTLTPGYTMKVSADTVAADLPYFGRAYQAPMGGTDAGMKFKATKFDYSVKEKKKNWVVYIDTKEIRGSPRMILTAFDNGTARLSITSTDRESISYNGVLKAIE